jgi:serine/threonine-protein kinase SRPK3
MEDLSVYHDSDLLHNQEQMSKYRPGGFHPVRLGDTFKGGRYKIHHKLGWGGFSTVWLAKDKKYVTVRRESHICILLINLRREQWVSIKIITADNSKQSRELRNFLSLAGLRQGHLHSKYIVQLLDDFFHQGPNGTHQCLVFELLGPTVDAVAREIYQGGDVLEPETILRMSKQLLQAITFLQEIGYAHGGMVGCSHCARPSRSRSITDLYRFK